MAEQSTLRGDIHFKVAENVTLEHLHGIVSRVAGLSGCQTCGILGIDLRFSSAPVESVKITDVSGAKSI